MAKKKRSKSYRKTSRSKNKTSRQGSRSKNGRTTNSSIRSSFTRGTGAKKPWLPVVGVVLLVLIGVVLLFTLSDVGANLFGGDANATDSFAYEDEPEGNLNTDSGVTDERSSSMNMPEDPTQRQGMYSTPPEMQIDPNKTYMATIETEKGDIVVELFADKAPKTVNNFVFLAREGFYDDTTFHRVIEGFMAQAGDPTGTGRGGPGYQFADEFHPELRHDSAGILSMANAGANTNGSQFFITYDATPWLDGAHSVFGKVVEGMDVLNSIRVRDPQRDSEPGDLIKTITIEER